MKTPDERKDFLSRLQLAASEADDMLGSCDASDILDSLENSRDYMFEAACMIEQLENAVDFYQNTINMLDAKVAKLESTYSQVSKALCGKKNATLDEVLKAVDQLKNDLQYTVDAANIMKDEALKLEQRLAQVERERDALSRDLRACFVRPTKMCRVCGNIKNTLCNSCERGDLFKWRGVCEENSK